MTSVLAQQSGTAGYHAARTLLHCLSAAATPAARLAAAAPLARSVILDSQVEQPALKKCLLEGLPAVTN